MLALAALSACAPAPIHLGDLPDCERDDAVTAAGICFEETHRELALGIDTLHIVAGNLVGDPNLELLAAGTRDGALAAELFEGSSEGPQAPSVDPMVSGCSAYPLARPLLGSGRDDLVFPSCTPGVIAYPGGDVGLGPPATFDLLVAPRSSVVADVDADGDIDLLALGADAAGAPALSVLLRGFDGTFAAPSLQPLAGITFDPNGIRAADFDGNGALDLAIVADGAPALAYVLGSGPGSFGMVVPLAPQHAVHAVAVADFDGDGDDDLVYASDVDRVVCIWTIDAVAEGAPRCWPLDELVPSQMAVADLDGDGVAEVALGDATAATVWLWDVDLASDEMALVGLATPAPTDLVLLADLQHDAAPDLITAHAASKTLSIRLGVP